jgi:hypothetical protein
MRRPRSYLYTRLGAYIAALETYVALTDDWDAARELAEIKDRHSRPTLKNLEAVK